MKSGGSLGVEQLAGAGLEYTERHFPSAAENRSANIHQPGTDLLQAPWGMASPLRRYQYNKEVVEIVSCSW